jgi:BNR repeat-containing family member
VRGVARVRRRFVWSALVLAAAAVVLLWRIGPELTQASTSADIPRADLRNGRVFIQDNLWTADDAQYAVWTAPDGTPYAGKRRREERRWQIVNLARIPGNPLAAPTHDDLHNAYVIALDSLGYVHVAGNMHNDPLRYIRSSRPRDLTSWEVGSVEGPTTIVTYPTFVELPDGTLLFWHRQGISGDGFLLLDRLPPGERRWQHLGVFADGRPTQESAYVNDVAVDPESGAIHVLFSWRLAGEALTTNDLGYTRSRDGGRSWETSDGRRLTLPMTHPTSEAVIDTSDTGSGLVNHGGLTLDARGRPHGAAMFERPGGHRSFQHVWLDGTRWRSETLDGVIDGRPAIAATREGKVWLLGAQDGQLVGVDVTPGSDRERRELAPAPSGWEVAYDTQALMRHGDVEILVPDGRKPRVVTADLQ